MASVLAAQAPTPADEQIAIRLAVLKTNGERLQLLGAEHIAVTPSLIQAIVDNGSKIFLKLDYAGALDQYRFGLSLAERAGDRSMQGRCLYLVGYALTSMGDLEQSLDAHSRSVKLARELGIPAWGLASRLNGLSIVQRRLGNYSAALETARESVASAQSITPEELREPLAVAQHVSAKLMIAQALNSLGGAQRLLGDYRSALETYEKSYRLALELNQREGAAFVINNIGEIYEEQGNLELSLEFYQRSLKLKQETGNQTALHNGFNNICAESWRYLQRHVPPEDQRQTASRTLPEGNGSRWATHQNLLWAKYGETGSFGVEV